VSDKRRLHSRQDGCHGNGLLNLIAKTKRLRGFCGSGFRETVKNWSSEFIEYEKKTRIVSHLFIHYLFIILKKTLYFSLNQRVINDTIYS
jgi:hypothetical protein